MDTNEHQESGRTKQGGVLAYGAPPAGAGLRTAWGLVILGLAGVSLAILILISTNGMYPLRLQTRGLAAVVGVLCGFIAICLAIAVAQTDSARGDRRLRRCAVIGAILGLIGTVGNFVPACALLDGARVTTGEEWCRRRMRPLGQAILMHAALHNGRFPDNLQQLVSDAPADDWDSLCCPVVDSRPALGSGYIYLGRGQTTTCPANTIILAEPLSNHGGKGINVLYADCTVAWLTGPAAANALKQALARPPTTTRPRS